MSVCLSVKSHLTYGASVRPENAVTYSAGNEGQKICGDLPETTAFKSYAAKHKRKSQYANYSGTPLMRTPLGPGSGVLIREVSLFQGLNFCACAID